MTNRDLVFLFLLAATANIIGLAFGILDDLLGAFIAILFIRLWDNRHVFDYLKGAENE